MPEKVTKMKIGVDLQCGKCYGKVKKLLCNFPEIRDQVYDEKQNIVTITVVCCNPEKIKDKLCYKGRCFIKNIVIVVDKPPEPEKKKEPEKKENKPAEPDKKKESEKSKPAHHPPSTEISVNVNCGPCIYGYGVAPPCCCGRCRPCYLSRCALYINEENALGCTIM